MSDYEEPAAKISKLEMPKDHDEEMDEGHEEWLSEGVLTDDDYNPTDHDKTGIDMDNSQGDTTPSLPDLETSNPDHVDQDKAEHMEQDKMESIDQDKIENVEEDKMQDIEHDKVEEIEQDKMENIEQDKMENIEQKEIENIEQDTLEKIEQVNTENIEQAKMENIEKDNMENIQQDTMENIEQNRSENIEQTLDNFENSQPPKIPDELGAFLVRKTDSKPVEDKKAESELDESTKQSDDDGNDTDELLRMLGEDGQKTKKDVKKAEQRPTQDSQSSDDDDDFIFEGVKASRVKVAKNMIMKKFPTKAVPETSDRDDTDASADERVTVKRMFVTRKLNNVAHKSTARIQGVNATTSVTKRLVTINRQPGPAKASLTSTPVPKPKKEMPVPKLRSTPSSAPKSVSFKDALELQKILEVSKVKKADPKETPKETPRMKQSPKPKLEPEEIIDEEEFLEEEDDFDIDEDLDSEPERLGQRIMRPERMEEEVPTDGDSHSEDGDSLYDDFPSSESEQEEWFTLDVRTERAGDYIPLLGSKARQLLTAEKQRVAARLSSLRENVAAVNESTQQQAEMLHRATLQLAELDAALKA